MDLVVIGTGLCTAPLTQLSHRPDPLHLQHPIFSGLAGSRHRGQALNMRGPFASWSEKAGGGRCETGREETKAGVEGESHHVGSWGSVPMGPMLVLGACLRAVPPRGTVASLVEGHSWDVIADPFQPAVCREAHSCGQRELPRQLLRKTTLV